MFYLGQTWTIRVWVECVWGVRCWKKIDPRLKIILKVFFWSFLFQPFLFYLIFQIKSAHFFLTPQGNNRTGTFFFFLNNINYQLMNGQGLIFALQFIICNKKYIYICNKKNYIYQNAVFSILSWTCASRMPEYSFCFCFVFYFYLNDVCDVT